MNWAKINPRNWKWGWIRDGEVWGLMIVGVFLLAMLAVMAWVIVDTVNSGGGSNYNYHRHFRERCHKVPHSYTIIANKDKCLIPSNGKIVIKFREH